MEKKNAELMFANFPLIRKLKFQIFQFAKLFPYFY